MANLYLIKSPSYRLLNREIDRISPPAANITYFSLNDVSIYDCIDDASYFGLFEETRVIVIKDVKYFGGKFAYEEETEALDRFFKSLSDDTIVIFVADQVNSKKKATQALTNNGGKIIDLTKVDDLSFEEMIKDYIAVNQITLENGVIQLLKSNCLNNIDLMIQEIDKLSLLNTNITKKMVEDSGSIYIEYKTTQDDSTQDNSAFDFSNAVVAKNFSEALKQLDKLITKGTEVPALVGLLSSSYTTMYMVKQAASAGLSDEEIADLCGFSNPRRVPVVKRNAKIYTTEDLKEIIIELSNIDKKAKSGYNGIYELKKFLLNL